MENIYKGYGVSDQIFQLSEEVLTELKPNFEALDLLTAKNQLRVIEALQKAGVRESAFGGSSGYGSYDAGRDALEDAYCSYFRCESALVRMQFSSGTHVLATCLRGILRPGDELLVVSSEVYDTLHETLGIGQEEEDKVSLKDFGISHKIVNLTESGEFDLPTIKASINERTKMIYIQKSIGYSNRPCLLNRQIGELVKALRPEYPNLFFMVDNCYGEFVEEEEPTAYGVDLCAGSLIKNPGAGIAESGAYVCGTEKAVYLVAQMMTASGIGGEIGPTLNQNRNLIRGFYFGPQVVNAALKSAMHAAGLLQKMGYLVNPLPEDERGDIVQRLALGDREKLIAFCQEIQLASPVDSAFAPVPSPMAGYDCDIIMASGSFVQGSSIELSCDGPLRPPYNAYLQGALNFTNARLAVLRAAERIAQEA